MIKVIKNGQVISMDSNRDKIENIDIVIKDDKIIDLVKDYNGEYDEIIDATNKIVMPGLINAHTHLGMSMFKATNDSLTLMEWLQNKIWPIEDKMTDEDTYYSVLMALIEMIKTGTTCSNDMYFNCDGALKAIKEIKVRSVFTRTLTDTNGDGESRITEFMKIYNENKDNPLITFTIAPHAFYTCNENYLKRCSEVATELNLPVHMHYNENKGEIEGTIKEYGKTPLDVLKSTGLINNKLILAHATFITDEELNVFKDKDISFVHNPLSNLNLGCGIADIKKYKDYVNISLGTDGVGSGNNLNMFYHMSLVDLLQKGKYEDPTVFNSYEVLKMATINGAKALGLDNKIGSIEVGKNADIIMLDMNNILTEPNVDIINNLVHNTLNNVDMTMINGEILLKDKKLCLDINEKDLINKIYEIIDRLS